MEVKPGYQQTEVGVIPEEWELKSFADIGHIKTGPFGTLLKADEYYANEGAPLVSVRDIGEGVLTFDEHTPLVPPLVVRRLPEYVLNCGDIVFGRKGGVDRSAIVQEGQAGCFLGSDGIRIRPSKACHAPFVAYQLQRKEIQAWLLQNATGTTMASMNQEILRRISLPFPSLPEQRAIAETLGDVDALLGALTQLIAKKRDLKQAAMQQLLTGQTRLPGFSREWEVKRLGEAAEVVMGQSLAGTSYNRDGLGAPLINGPTEFTDKHPTKIQWTSQPTTFCRKGDMLLCVRGSSTGRINISDDEYCIGRGVAAIRAKAEADTAFVTFQVSGAVQKILAATTGSTFPSIDGKSIRAIEVLAPPLPEQTAIAAVLSDMDAELAATGAAAGQDPRPQTGHDAGTADRKDAPGMSTVGQIEKKTHTKSGKFAAACSTNCVDWAR